MYPENICDMKPSLRTTHSEVEPKSSPINTIGTCTTYTTADTLGDYPLECPGEPENDVAVEVLIVILPSSSTSPTRRWAYIHEELRLKISSQWAGHDA